MKPKRGVAGMVMAAALCVGPGGAWAASAGDGKGAAAAVAAVKDVCLPLLQGAKIEAVAKTARLKNTRDGWILPIDGKRRIAFDPPGGANPHVCAATVIHHPDAGPSILEALNGWASSQSPGLQPLKQQEKATGALYQLTTSSWSGKLAGSDLALVYTEDKSLDGKPVAGALDQATLTVGLTPAS